MASLIVRIRFSGLCAFVPARPLNQTQNTATALFVSPRESHMPHHTILIAPEGAYPAVVGASVRNRPIDFSFTDKTDGPLHACQLFGEELTLLAKDAGGGEIKQTENTLEFTGGNRPPDCPDFSPSDQSFSWVANMAKIGAGAVKRSLLTDLDVSSDLSIRMKLEQGSLSTGGFRGFPGNLRVRWYFGGGISSAMAEEVVWRIEFPDSVTQVVLRSTPLLGNPRQPDLILLPQDNVVQAAIFNVPLGSLLKLDPACPLDPDHHFHEFFRLAEGNPAHVIPIPDTSKFCRGSEGAANPKCPPAVFSPLNE